MYLSLVPLMYFLFCILLEGKGPDPLKRLPKDLPLLVYLLHPLFLILVRGFAGITGLSIFTDNSVVHFLAVAAASFAGSWLLAMLRAFARARFLPRLKTQLSRKGSHARQQQNSRSQDTANDKEGIV